MRNTRPIPLCRSWLFVEGANERAIATAAQSGADVLMHELEDFTPPALRAKARALAPEAYAAWRAAGVQVAVRVNPLDGDGLDDLAAVMRGRPDIVALPKVAEPRHVDELDRQVARFEREYDIPEGSTRLLPNIEFARGLIEFQTIAKVSRRTVACLLASEDLAADLGAERGPEGVELAYARQRFIVECVAAGVTAVDCPYTWSDAEGVARDTKWARRLGYGAKSLVDAAHARIVNELLTPRADDVAHAREIVHVFEAARARGEGRVEHKGLQIELPAYMTAKRLIARSEALAQYQ